MVKLLLNLNFLILFNGFFSFAQENKEYTIIFKNDSLVTITPEDFKLGDQISVSSNADLNSDGLQDLVLNFYLCGNYGECMYGIFVQQKNGKYNCVFEPDYWSTFRILSDAASSSFSQWKKFIISERSGEPTSEAEEVKLYQLKFTGFRYEVR